MGNTISLDLFLCKKDNHISFKEQLKTKWENIQNILNTLAFLNITFMKLVVLNLITYIINEIFYSLFTLYMPVNKSTIYLFPSNEPKVLLSVVSSLKR